MVPDACTAPAYSVYDTQVKERAYTRCGFEHYISTRGGSRTSVGSGTDARLR